MKRSCELVESIIVVIVLISSVQCECPPPFVQLETGCYFFSSDLKNWWDAAYSCRKHDSILAEVETVEEDTLLNQKVQEFNRPFWIGGSDLAKEYRWVWESTQEPILYTGWDTNRPAGGASGNLAGNCLVYWGPPTYKWADGACHVPESYICEKKQAPGRDGVKWKDAGECIRDSCGHLGIVFSAVGKLPVHTCSRSSKSDDECDPPFVQLATGCYFFSRQDLNWWEAAESCRNHDSVLATIESLEEDVAIQSQVKKENPEKHYWLGGFDLGHEGRWVWESTLKPFLYTAWGELIEGTRHFQPDNGGANRNEHCFNLAGRIYGNKWNDYTCETKTPYICKRVASSKSISTEIHVHAAPETNSAKHLNCPSENNVGI